MSEIEQGYPPSDFDIIDDIKEYDLKTCVLMLGWLDTDLKSIKGSSEKEKIIDRVLEATLNRMQELKNER